MMEAVSRGSEFVLAVGLLMALVALVLGSLQTHKPDPKMALLVTLLENLPKDERELHSGGETRASSSPDEAAVAGPRKFSLLHLTW
jgi:hypothetical protein